MEVSIVSNSVVYWCQDEDEENPFIFGNNRRLGVDAKVCNLQEVRAPSTLVEKLRSINLQNVVAAGDIIDLPSIWIGLETSAKRKRDESVENVYVKMEGVDTFLLGLFGGNVPSHVTFRVDIPILKETRKKFALTPKLTSQFFTSQNGREIDYARIMKVTSKLTAAEMLEAWKNPKSRWSSQLVLTIMPELNEENEASKDMLNVTSMMLDDKFCDGTIVTEGGDKIKCHRSILAAQSDQFALLLHANMDSSGSGELRLPGISGETARALVQYLYTRKIQVPEGNLGVSLELLEVGEKYEMPHLQTKMEQVFSTKIGHNCPVEIVFRVFLHAVNIGSRELKQKALEILMRKFDELKGLPRYKEMFLTNVNAAMELTNFLGSKCILPQEVTNVHDEEMETDADSD